MSADQWVAPRLDPPPLSQVLDRDVGEVPLLRVRRGASTAVSIPDPEEAAYSQLRPHLGPVQPGESVAIGVGSRGIADIARVVAGMVRAVRERGAEPFIVPAMGSHGGSTAAGQAETLADLGIRADVVDAPVRATMNTVSLGEHADVAVAVDAIAAQADHILLVNRLKSHTSFSGEIESGLAKMLAIGLGKRHGASELHRLGPAHLERRIRSTAGYIASKLPVLGGLALVEGRDKRLIRVAFIHAEGIGGEPEAKMLEEAKAFEARLPFSAIDVLIVDQMGKDFSGTGMDTNVIGRRMVRSMPELSSPRITGIVCLRVSHGSHGNAVGIGLADFVPVAALAGFDPVATYANALTAGSQAWQRAQIPIVMRDDTEAVKAAILTCDVPVPEDVRLVRIRDTLHVDDLLISRTLRDELPQDYEVLDANGTLFDEDGHIADW